MSEADALLAKLLSNARRPAGTPSAGASASVARQPPLPEPATVMAPVGTNPSTSSSTPTMTPKAPSPAALLTNIQLERTIGGGNDGVRQRQDAWRPGGNRIVHKEQPQYAPSLQRPQQQQQQQPGADIPFGTSLAAPNVSAAALTATPAAILSGSPLAAPNVSAAALTAAPVAYPFPLSPAAPVAPPSGSSHWFSGPRLFDTVRQVRAVTCSSSLPPKSQPDIIHTPTPQDVDLLETPTMI